MEVQQLEGLAGFRFDWHELASRKKETSDTFTLKLRPLKNARKEFEAGQFNMLYAYGVGEAPISISGGSPDGQSIFHTVRAVGPVTKALAHAEIGDLIGVKGPFGRGWPCKEAWGHDVVVVAGGIGLAPLRPAINRILQNRERYGRIHILYGGRTPSDLLYKKDLSRWRGRLDTQLLVTVDRGDESWHGHIGVVTTLFRYVQLDAENTYAFVCGPEIMMRFTIQELKGQGISDDRIFISMERNMKCGVGLCGHCQIGPLLVCSHGPVFRFSEVRDFFGRREL